MAKSKKQASEETREVKLQNSFADFVERNVKTIVIVAIVLVVVVVAALIITSVRTRNSEARFIAIDELDSQYSSLAVMDAESAEYTAAKEELVAGLAELTSGNDYPANKARFLNAMILNDDGNYSAAADEFLALANSLRNDNYMAPLALYNAGACFENAGDTQAALDAYQRIWDTWNSDAAESPKALFSVARIQEERGNTDLARAALTQLRDQFPSSEYGRLAMNRLAYY